MRFIDEQIEMVARYELATTLKRLLSDGRFITGVDRRANKGYVIYSIACHQRRDVNFSRISQEAQSFCDRGYSVLLKKLDSGEYELTVTGSRSTRFSGYRWCLETSDFELAMSIQRALGADFPVTVMQGRRFIEIEAA